MTAPGSPTAPADPQAPAYPPAHRDDLTEDLHGRRVPDPYRWLEDAAGADTQEWLAAQDKAHRTPQADRGQRLIRHVEQQYPSQARLLPGAVGKH